MTKNTVKEVYLLRSIACLCVVLVHSITRIVELYGTEISSHQEASFMTLRLLLTFGTPVFIFLSEFLLSYSYSENIPDNFIKKRVQLILYPYVSMGFIYAILMTHEANNLYEGIVLRTFVFFIIRNLLFGFYRHGYFIIVIFQFYLLHLALHKYLSRTSPKRVLSVSLFINLIYLGFFNFVDPVNIPYGQFLWRGLTWGSFLSWIFYFTLGYYSGKYYEAFIEKIKHYSSKVILLPFLSMALVVYLYLSGILTINDSKRIDIVIFSTSMIFLIYYIAVNLKEIPKTFIFISRFSFGIYLLHMLFLYVGVQFLRNTSYLKLHPLLTLIVLFLVSIVASIISTFVLSKFKIGKYIIGNVKGSNSAKRNNTTWTSSQKLRKDSIY